MLPKRVMKIATVKTKLGRAFVLQVDGTRVLAFPDRIDRFDAVAIDTFYRTLIWQDGTSLQHIAQFPSGPCLPGWDILGAADTHVVDVVDSQPNRTTHHRSTDNIVKSVQKRRRRNLNPQHQLAFDFAHRALLNRPAWPMNQRRRLRQLFQQAAKRRRPRNKNH